MTSGDARASSQSHSRRYLTRLGLLTSGTGSRAGDSAAREDAAAGFWQEDELQDLLRPMPGDQRRPDANGPASPAS